MEIHSDQRIIIYIPDTPRQLPKVNEDEMRISGRPKNQIPSRAFHTLQRMTGEDDGGNQSYEEHSYPHGKKKNTFEFYDIHYE